MSLLQQEFDGQIDHVVLIAGNRGEDDVDLAVEGLSLVQVLGTWRTPPRLVFVTAGAVPVDGLVSAEERNPAHTALWGFSQGSAHATLKAKACLSEKGSSRNPRRVNRININYMIYITA